MVVPHVIVAIVNAGDNMTKYIRVTVRMPKGGSAIKINEKGDEESLQKTVDFWTRRGYSVIEKAEIYEL